jgi:transposase
LAEIADQIETLGRQVDKLEGEIVATAKNDEVTRRLATVPGVGAITAASIKALVPDPGGFAMASYFQMRFPWQRSSGPRTHVTAGDSGPHR